MKFNQNTKHLIHENASENIVCEMAAILSEFMLSNQLRLVIKHHVTAFDCVTLSSVHAEGIQLHTLLKHH